MGAPTCGSAPPRSACSSAAGSLGRTRRAARGRTAAAAHLCPPHRWHRGLEEALRRPAGPGRWGSARPPRHAQLHQTPPKVAHPPLLTWPRGAHPPAAPAPRTTARAAAPPREDQPDARCCFATRRHPPLPRGCPAAQQSRTSTAIAPAPARSPPLLLRLLLCALQQQRSGVRRRHPRASGRRARVAAARPPRRHRRRRRGRPNQLPGALARGSA